MKKFLFIVGARPNFIKIAPLIEEAKKYKDIKPVLVHTGQHYDFEMSQIFFRDLCIPIPDYNLEVGQRDKGERLAKIISRLEPILLEERPDIAVVVGDADSTLAGALCAKKLGIKLVHVEAGLRSFNSKMPEESNRKLTDHCSDLLFVTENSAVKNLQKEGIARSQIHFVGNVMIDTLKRHIAQGHVPHKISKLGLKPKEYAILTLHRAENVDEKKILSGILKAVADISKHIKVIWPVHPRTRKQVKAFRLSSLMVKNMECIEPLGYLEMIGAMQHAKVVLTDSGGMQEETTVLKVPCVTLRTETERPVTVKIGTNVVAGITPEAIVRVTLSALRRKKKSRIPKFWDGRASERIIKIIRSKYL